VCRPGEFRAWPRASRAGGFSRVASPGFPNHFGTVALEEWSWPRRNVPGGFAYALREPSWSGPRRGGSPRRPDRSLRVPLRGSRTSSERTPACPQRRRVERRTWASVGASTEEWQPSPGCVQRERTHWNGSSRPAREPGGNAFFASETPPREVRSEVALQSRRGTRRERFVGSLVALATPIVPKRFPNPATPSGGVAGRSAEGYPGVEPSGSGALGPPVPREGDLSGIGAVTMWAFEA